MAVVGAGSLCAGSRELPRGVDRQYNLITIDDEMLNARIHVREMQLGNQFARSSRAPFAISGSMELNWERPTDSYGRPIDPVAIHERELTLRAERLLHEEKPGAALELLRQTTTGPGTYARTLLVSAARASKDWAMISAALAEPVTADELVALVEALLAQHDYAGANEALRLHARELKLAPPITRALTEQSASMRDLAGVKR